MHHRLQDARCRKGFLQPVIASDRVRYVGDPVAVVLGDSPALAEDGVGAIALDIEELPPVPDRHASGRGKTLLFEEAGTKATLVFTGSRAMSTRRGIRSAAGFTGLGRLAIQRAVLLCRLMDPRPGLETAIRLSDDPDIAVLTTPAAILLA
jgi:carbon-monoxide dehydrogenase large subunit